MKCKRPACPNEGHPKLKYCSRSCAPYGALTDARKVHSEWSPGPDGSGILDHGAPSWGSFENEPQNVLAENLGITTTSSSPTNSVESIMPEEKQREICNPSLGTEHKVRNDLLINENILKEPEPSGMPGIMQTKTENLPTSQKDVALVNRIETSFVQCDSSSGVLLDSVSLIDKSANHLHGFIASVAKEETVTGPMMSNAAKCAKEIAALMRVKLDLYKASKK